MNNHKKWKILNEHIYESFPIFTIKRSSRLNPKTQQPYDFFLMEGLDWANIIPLTSNNEVVLVRQYRHGSDEITLETPGGCIEKGEDPKASVLRELREETGYCADDASLLGIIHPNPAMQAMHCFCYVAYGVEKKLEPQLDDGEDIEVILKPLEETLALIQQGGITHSMVLAAFGLFGLR